MSSHESGSGQLKVLRTHGTLVFCGPLIGDVPTIAMNEIARNTRLTYGTLRTTSARAKSSSNTRPSCSRRSTKES